MVAEEPNGLLIIGGILAAVALRAVLGVIGMRRYNGGRPLGEFDEPVRTVFLPGGDPDDWARMTFTGDPEASAALVEEMASGAGELEATIGAESVRLNERCRSFMVALLVADRVTFDKVEQILDTTTESWGYRDIVPQPLLVSAPPTPGWSEAHRKATYVYAEQKVSLVNRKATSPLTRRGAVLLAALLEANERTVNKVGVELGVERRASSLARISSLFRGDRPAGVATEASVGLSQVPDPSVGLSQVPDPSALWDERSPDERPKPYEE